MRSPHAPTGIAAALLAAGAVLLFMGWKGGAATLFIPTQVAFAVSGSIAGLAVVGVGLTVLAVHTTRLNTARRSQEMRRLVTDSVDLLAAVRARTEHGTRKLRRPAAASVAVVAPEVSAPPSSNGHATAAGASTLFVPDVVIVPGARTFHAVGCRIVKQNEAALHLSAQEATAAGLRPCRICAPAPG